MKGSAQRKQQQIKARKSFLHSLTHCSPFPHHPTPSLCCCFAFVSCLVPLLCMFHRSDDEDVVASLMGADFCRNLRLKCFALAIVHCAAPARSSPLSLPVCLVWPILLQPQLLFFCLYKFYFNFLWLVFVVAQPFNRSTAQPLSHSTRFASVRLFACSPARLLACSTVFACSSGCPLFVLLSVHHMRIFCFPAH